MERPARPRRRERTREALLDAAAHVFAQQGFDGASVDAIADAAGFTKGAVYSNFGSKEELFFAVVERRQEQRLERFTGVIDPEAPELEALLGRAAALVTSEQEEERDWVLLEVEVWLYAQRHPEGRARLAQFQRQNLERITAFVVDMAASAGLRLTRPADEVAALMLATSNGITQLRFADPEASHDELFGMMLALLGDSVIRPA